MNYSSVFRILNSFDDMALKRFIKFVQSPYHNNRSILLELCLVLVKLIEQRRGEGEGAATDLPPKEDVWQAAYKDSFKSAKFSDYLYRIYELLKAFLVAENLAQKPSYEQYFLIDQLVQQETIAEAQSLYERFETDASAESSRAMYHLQWQTRNLVKTHEDIFDKQTTTNLNALEDANQWLDAMFLAHKLHYMCNAFNDIRILRGSSEVTEFAPFLEAWLRSKPSYLERFPLLRGYYMIWEMLQYGSENEAYFKKSIDFITQNEERWTKDEVGEFYKLLTNQASHYCTQGKMEYYRTLFDLYKRGLECGYFDTWVSKRNALYKNVLKIGIHIGATEDMEKWLQQQPEGSISSEMRDYCIALLYFEQAQKVSDYNDAINLAMRINFNDIFHKLDLHCLLLRAYYKVNDARFEPFKKTFATALRRSQVTNEKQNAYKNFMDYCGKINSFRQGKNRSATIKNSLQNELKAVKEIYNKGWLWAELDAL